MSWGSDDEDEGHHNDNPASNAASSSTTTLTPVTAKTGVSDTASKAPKQDGRHAMDEAENEAEVEGEVEGKSTTTDSDASYDIVSGSGSGSGSTSKAPESEGEDNTVKKKNEMTKDGRGASRVIEEKNAGDDVGAIESTGRRPQGVEAVQSESIVGAKEARKKDEESDDEDWE